MFKIEAVVVGAGVIGLSIARTLFPSLPHIRASLTSWRADYNLNRPHSGIGWLTPNEYAETFNPRRDLTLRSMASSAPAPLAHPGQIGQTNRPSLLHAG